MATLLTAVNPPNRPVFPAKVADIAALKEAISPARLSTYLGRSHGNVRRALDLYAWNIRAGAALYPILHVNEVALRNAVNRALVSQFGAEWPYAEGFLRSLPAPERNTFEKCRAKLERSIGARRATTGDVVAADREIVHGRADTIRRLRNRIAHWEPLLDVDMAGGSRPRPPRGRRRAGPSPATC